MHNQGKTWPWSLIGCIFCAQCHVLAAAVIFTPHLLEKSALPGQRWEQIGLGQLLGPEDVAYHARSKLIYTGCSDGWIKLVTVGTSAIDTTVENWVNTGGRPLGIAFGRHNDVIVADAEKGLLNITRGGRVKILTVGDKDVRFKLIDSVVVAKNGVVYFTEASYKYSLIEYMLDILEGQPHGRLWSYDPASNRTRVLLTGLHFSNGVALSPGQDFVVFCETTRKRCRKYYVKGNKKGSVADFIRLPGYPDNIRYVGNGNFLIALVMPSTSLSRNSTHNNTARQEEESGVVFVVNAKGAISAQYSGAKTSLITSAEKVGNYIYCGSLVNLCIVRLRLQKNSSFVTI